MDLLDKALSPATLNGLTVRNRIFKAATFEGRATDGAPKDSLRDFHRTIAEGGTAMTTLAYCAVEADGRVMKEMMYIHEAIADKLAAIASDVHAAGSTLSGQLTHCGNFSQNEAFQGKRPKGPNRGINFSGIPAGLPFAGAMNAGDMDRLIQNYVDASTVMKRVGFDALEIHFGHGYGLSQFISPKTNKRSDQYGGVLVNRMRLPLRVLEAVRGAVGEDFPLLGKINLRDGIKGGLELDEAVEVAALLDKAGIDAVIPSGGTSSFNPMLLFRGDSLAPGMLEYEKNPMMRFILKRMGDKIFKAYPYHELYFMEGSKRVRDAMTNAKLCYIGGVSTVEALEEAMAEFDFVQLGRALIKDPAMVNNLALQRGQYVNGCTHCNRWAAMIKNPDGVHCVLN